MSSAWAELESESEGEHGGQKEHGALKLDWEKYIKPTLEEIWTRRGQQSRPLSLMSLCSGMCTEAFACTRLQVQVELEATCDPRYAAVRFADKKYGVPSKHHFEDVFDLLEEVSSVQDPCGRCLTHDDICAPEVHRDLMVAGFPCQPFTQQRGQRYKDRGVVGHKGFCLMDAMVAREVRLKPRSFVFENVSAFSRPAKNMSGTPLDQFLARLKQANYWVAAMHLHLSVWVDANRSRSHGLEGRETTSYTLPEAWG